MQPQALEIEAAVLGACLIEQDAIGMVSDFLEPESFYDQKNQIIFATIKSLAAENKPIDILTVTEQLKADNISEQHSFLGRIFTGDVTNESDTDLDCACVVIIFRKDGEITGGDVTYVDNLRSGASKSFDTLPDDFDQYDEYEAHALVW